MNHDRGFPDYCGLIKIVRQDGTEITDFKTKDEGSTRCVLLDDPGDDIITVYCYSGQSLGHKPRRDGSKNPRRTSRT